jgi:hypothetical protein
MTSHLNVDAEKEKVSQRTQGGRKTDYPLFGGQSTTSWCPLASQSALDLHYLSLPELGRTAEADLIFQPGSVPFSLAKLTWLGFPLRSLLIYSVLIELFL